MPDGAASLTDTISITPGPETQRQFRDALGCFGTGVCVVTTQSEAGPLAITANSFAAVSLDPALVLWSPARASRRYAAFAQAKRTAIHIMAADQLPMAGAFAQDGQDFGHCEWAQDEHGTPVLPGALARFDCTAHAAYDGGDHTILVAQVLRAHMRPGAPLLFARGSYGHFTDAPAAD